MNLISAFIHNPVKVAVGVLLVALFGIVGLLGMPMQLTPEVQIPTITIETRWPGASPQEVEREIIQEQEEQLKSVEGVTKLSSQSMDSRGEITMEFLVGTNMEEALLKVNSRLQQVPEYPEDADEPIITTANSSDRPIAWFILSTRMPPAEQITEFQEAHPELANDLEQVKASHNEGLAMLRLRTLARKHPEVGELLPPDIDVAKLRKFAEDFIEARFERVPGVSNSNVFGGREEELQVIIDPQRLAARGLTVNDVRMALRGQNQDTSGGDFWEGKRRYVVRTLGQFRSPEQVEHTLLAYRDGAPVYVRDVGEAQLGHKKPDGLVRRFGTSSIAVNAQRESGANVLDVMQGLREANAELNATVLRDREVDGHLVQLQLTQVYDETEYIYSAVGLVNQNIFIGGALTICVLMLFLHLGVRTLLFVPLMIGSALAAAYVSPWFFVLTLAMIIGVGFWFARGSLVIALAIPTSIIGSFLVLSLLGRSLNVVSLAGLAFAVGMLVDNAVVVLENVYRHSQIGDSPFTAAVRGAKEVWGAVIASTLTTLAVFIPVLFVQEEAGQLFRDIALAISSAVGLSLIVSITVIPTAAARLLRRTSTAQAGRPGGAFAAFEQPAVEASKASHRDVPPPAPDGDGNHRGRHAATSPGNLQALLVAPLASLGHDFVRAVVGLNAWLQRGMLRRLAAAAGLVGISLLAAYLLLPKAEYLPTGNRNLVFGIILPPAGYNLDQLMAIGEQLEKDLQPYWDVDPDSPEADELDYPAIGDFFYVARGRQVFLGLRAADPLRAAGLVDLVREVAAKLPGTFAAVQQSSLFEQGLAAGRSIDVEVTGPELTELVGLGGQILGQVAQFNQELPPDSRDTWQMIPRPSLDLSSPEVHVVPKWEQAADMGVTAADLGYTVDALVDGAYAADYFVGGDKIDLSIIGQQRFAERTQDLESLPVSTPRGELVPLAAVADVSLSSGPEQINHRERQRAITIQVTPPLSVAIEDAMDRINNNIVTPLRESGRLGGQYQINLAGTADKLRATWSAIWFNLVLALVITYLLMAALFESWLYPFVIILSVPLGAVGGLAGLKLLNAYLYVFGVGAEQHLDVLTMLGFVILIGTVVNNPILIVHQALNHMRDDGMAMRESILESVRTRIRPIFMTTITTVFGLLPLVLFPGAGSELYRGLGSVVLGGLLLSTVFTLVLVPTLFSLTLEVKEVILGRLGRRARATEVAPVPSRPESPIAVSSGP